MKEWCKNIKLGQCQVVGDNLPSLAEKTEKRVTLTDEIIVLTDHNSILNFWGLYGYQKEYTAALSSGVFPESITIRISRNTTQEFLRCTASNCRSAQKECSHYG